eukprot:m51a1_g5941 hypothetical protein (147) ;mRNA; r:119467-120023
MIYALYVFNRKFSCVYYCEWNRPEPSDPEKLAARHKLISGMLYSLKQFCVKIAVEQDPNDKTELHCYRTGAYKLHVYEAATGMRFVLMTDPQAPDMNGALCTLYQTDFVDYVAKNPLYNPAGDTINCDLFSAAVQRLVRGHPNFRS